MDAGTMVIELEDICFAYPRREPVLKGVSFRLQPREKIGLIGPNGSGKSTLLHIIMGLLQPSSGTVRLFGRQARTEKEFREVRTRIGLLFQNADDQLFSPTVLEDVAFGLLNMGIKPSQAKRDAIKTLEELHLERMADRVTHHLSGGEKKLVALATVLVMKPEILLLDEPTTGLDEATDQRIIEILNGIEAGYVIVSHEYDFLALTTRTVYSFRDGKIINNSDSSLLHSHYHSHPAGIVHHSHAQSLK